MGAVKDLWNEAFEAAEEAGASDWDAEHEATEAVVDSLYAKAERAKEDRRWGKG